MQSNNLTISIPQVEGKPACDKNCDYCITDMTGRIRPDHNMMIRNLEKIKKIITLTRPTSTLITSKGEPCLNFDTLIWACKCFKNYPGLELQTNGLWLHKNLGALDDLKENGMDCIAISIDRLDQMDRFGPMLDRIVNGLNLTTRICLNITDMIPIEKHVMSIIDYIKEFPVHQLLFRHVMIPDKTVDTEKSIEAQSWIKRHVDFKRYKALNDEFLREIDQEKDKVRKLHHGLMLYAFAGMSVSFSDYCIQEYNTTEDMRNVIWLENGHACTSWDKSVESRLF